MTKHAVAAFALILPLAATAPALGQGTEAQRAACSGDAFRLCASSLPNPDKAAVCLHREMAQLSPACRAVFEGTESGGPSTTDAAAKPASDPAPKADAEAKPAPSAEPPKPVAADPATPSAPKPPAVAEKPDAKPASSAPVRSASKPAPAKRAGVRQVYRTPVPARPAVRQASAAPARHVRRARADSDLAQARYWMKRVTGLSIGNLAGLLPN